MNQESFSLSKDLQNVCFGGSLLKNSHAKEARPLSSKKALLVVMKVSQSNGIRSLLKSERIIHNMILKQGRLHNVKVFQVKNSGSNIQLLLRFTKRRSFQNFLRSTCGLIARKTLQAERGRSSINNGTSPKFWSQRPFTQIVNWGPEFKKLLTRLDPKASSSLSLASFGFVSDRILQNLGVREIKKLILSELSSA